MKKIFLAWMLLLGLGSTLWIEKATAQTVSFTIRNNDDWNKFRDEVQKSQGRYWVDATLEADITTGGAIGLYEHTPYRGTFNGNGHTVTINTYRDDGKSCALFCYAGDCNVRDLHVRGNVYGGMHSAGLIGTAQSGNPTFNIDRVWVSTAVDVTGSHGGGIIGHSNYANVYMNDCRFDGTVNTNCVGGSYVGCIIGWCEGGGWFLHRVYNSPSVLPMAERIYFCVDYVPGSGAINPWGLNKESSLTITSTAWSDWRVAHYNKTDQNEVVNLMNAEQANSWTLVGGQAVPKKFEGEDIGDLRALPDASWQILSEGSSSGKTLQSGRYYVSKDITFTNSSKESGLTIAPQSIVYIHVPKGVTLTAKGGNASGRDGAGAGILLPLGSTLYFEGEGKVVATGGNAANGGDGTNGVNASCDFDNMKVAQKGGGGPGGAGGGGAGAGIGTRGGAGGAGGSAPETEWYYQTWTEDGKNGGDGFSGRTAEPMGELYVSNGFTVSAEGGSKGRAGRAGSAGTSCLRYGYRDYSIPGGGGGGGGGFGGAAKNIGTGGPGGGGGGGGAKGSHEWASSGFFNFYANGGKGGRNGDGSYADDGGTAGVSTDNVNNYTCNTNKRSWVLEKERGRTSSNVRTTVPGGSCGGCGAASRGIELKYKYLVDYQVCKSKSDYSEEKTIRVGYQSTESRKEIAILIPSAYSMGLTKQDKYLSQWYNKSNFSGSSTKVGDTYIIRQGSNTLYSYWKDYKDLFPKGIGSKTDPFIIQDAMLLDLADYVNDGYNTRDVYFKQEHDILVSNILSNNHRGSQWTPIGYDLPFEGDYDGGGFCIRNGEIGSKAGGNNLSAVGIFGKVLGSVHNVGVESITISRPADGGASCGTLAGMLMGDKIEQRAGWMRDCYAANNNIIADYAGALVGNLTGVANMSHCHGVNNTLQGNHSGGVCSQILDNAKAEYCYTTAGNIASKGGIANTSNCKPGVSADVMASGEIAWLLNDRSIFGVAWYQDIDTPGQHDAFPVLNTASSPVYCDGNKYSNSILGPLTKFTGKGTVDEPFVISNRDDLEHLAKYCNEGNRSTGLHFLQTADIDLKGSGLTTIGIGEDRCFEGIYDGNAHTIRNGMIEGNDFVGIFGHVTGKVTRLAVEKMTVKSGSGSTARVGAIAGRLRGKGEISNCFVKECTVTGDNEKGVAGAMVADMYDEAAVRHSLGYQNKVSAASVGYICGEMVDKGTCLLWCYTDGIMLVNSRVDKGDVTDCYPSLDQASLEDGSTTYGLNGAVDNPDPVWFQNIDEGSDIDETPVLLSSHAKVFKIDGAYTNDGEQLGNLGEGTQEDPYKIGTPEDLKKLIVSIGQMKRSNFYVLQTADINMRDSVMVPIGTGTQGFEGHYDGGGYVIRNVDMHYDKSECVGLFNNILGTVERLGIENGTFKAEGSASRVGALAGKLSAGGVLRNCYVTGSRVDFNNTPGVVVGALVGEQTDASRIESCYGYKNTITGQYDGQSHYGDIVGYIGSDAVVSRVFTDGSSLCADRQSGAKNIANSETGISDFRFNSGEICYLLNGSKDNGQIWRQTIRNDHAPVTNPTHPSIYRHTLDYQAMYTNSNNVPSSVFLTLSPNYDGDDGDAYEVFKADSTLYVPGFKLKPHAVLRDYYDFVGWCTQADGKGEFYAVDGEMLLERSDTLYAVWGLKVPSDLDSVLVEKLTEGTVYFKVFDDGGHDTPYGYNYNGKLNLSAPDGHIIVLSGTVSTEAVDGDGKPRDYMVVYDGDGKSDSMLANDNGVTTFVSKVNGEKEDIGLLISSTPQMTIEFVSDDVNCYDGLDLTVTVLPKEILELAGTGSKESPFQVETVRDLLTVDKYFRTTGESNVYIEQVADIDMQGEEFTPLATSVKSFEGHYNGGGYEIRNMKMKSGVHGTVGLFHHVSGVVERLGIANSSFTGVDGDTLVGAFAGKLSGQGQLRYCYVRDNTVSCDGSAAAGVFVGEQADSSSIVSGYAYHVAGITSVAGKTSQTSTQDLVFTSGQDFSDEHFASGEVCYLLNGSKSNDVVWRQTLGTDSLPVFSDKQGVVYTYLKNDKPAYSNTAVSRPQYHISNKEEFYASIGKEADLYLMQDIDLGELYQYNYLRGNLDGGGHTITYSINTKFRALFQVVTEEASVKHLRVEARIVANSDCGGIACVNRGVISDSYFSGDVTFLNSRWIWGSPSSFAGIVLDNYGTIDHCSATGKTTIGGRLYPDIKDGNAPVHCIWVDPNDSKEYAAQKAQALEAQADYPVYAQGILDAVGPEIVLGDTTISAPGRHLASLVITDGERFNCPAEVTVDDITYKRRGSNGAYEPWILPFDYTIGGSMSDGGVEFYRFEKDSTGNIVTKQIESGTTYQVAANEPLAFRSPNGSEITFRMSLFKDGSNQPMTIRMPSDGVAMSMASTKDVARVMANYDEMPADRMKNELMYVWNNDQEDFVLSDGKSSLQSFRYYLQYADKLTGNNEPWERTDWARKQRREQANSNRAARRSEFSTLIAEGWQPVTLDYDNVVVTDEMLADYEILALSDIYDAASNAGGDDRRYAVTVIYEPVEAGMELLVAHPLLVRAKRADVAPLALEEIGSEIDGLLKWAKENMEDEKLMEFFDMSHLWCSTFAGRYDVWQFPMPERNSVLSEAGALIFNATGKEPCFYRVGADDNVFMQPMSYCFTAYDERTYENLPLEGDRINVVVYGYSGQGDATGIENLNADKAAGRTGEGSTYNLQGQKVDDSYRGIIIKNGRKVMRR